MQIFERIIIFYFSGTGNALQAANWIKDYAPIQCSLVNIADKITNEKIEISENTLVGFCYPTHGFNAPPIVLKFIKNLNKTQYQNKFFILNTRAGMKMSKIFTPGISGTAFLLPNLILQLKGYKCIGYRPLDLPSNWISVHPGLKEKVITSMFRRCKNLTTIFISKLLKNEKSFNRLYELPIDILVIPIAIIYYFYGRFILSKAFIATESCNSCSICEKECPVDAIKMIKGRPYWTFKCESCMHCINSCPSRSIETPHGYTAIVWYLTFSIIPALILLFTNRYISSESMLLSISIKILGAALGLFIIYLSHKLLRQLMKNRFFNNVVSLSSLTKWKFWRRYKAPNLKPNK